MRDVEAIGRRPHDRHARPHDDLDMSGVQMSHKYSFVGSSFGFDNCSICDDDAMCNEYVRDDSLVVWLCKKCEDRLHL